MTGNRLKLNNDKTVTEALRKFPELVSLSILLMNDVLSWYDLDVWPVVRCQYSIDQTGSPVTCAQCLPPPRIVWRRWDNCYNKLVMMITNGDFSWGRVIDWNSVPTFITPLISCAPLHLPSPPTSLPLHSAALLRKVQGARTMEFSQYRISMAQIHIRSKRFPWWNSIQ